MQYTGWTMTVLAILFLLLDAGMKVAGARASVDATAELGFGADQVRLLGVILLIVTLLYALPATSIFGAILVTAYLGGAIAVHLQHRSPLASHVLFGVYVGLFVWLGAYLRTPALRSLVPILRPAPLAQGN